ncbi:hypothetical protein amyaer_3980 [Microcystis aeruginosa NIES-2481]|nr:hypothetical protein amyaer_3980 [Microcystis aeruginosa NIES-2481]
MKYKLNLAEVKIPVAKMQLIYLRNAVNYSLPVSEFAGKNPDFQLLISGTG